MSLAFDRSQGFDASSPAPRTPRPVAPEAVGRGGATAERGRRFAREVEAVGGPNTISASQARAARRREARRDQQAVAAWLRELSR